MAILDICSYPQAILRKQCMPVTEINGNIVQLVGNMRETMLHANGIGLAAPQIGLDRRVFVADTSEHRDSPLVFINPIIVEREGNIKYEEGCLSIPGVSAHVSRAKKIVVKSLSLEGEEITRDAEDLLAVCIQHEIDHLDGVLFFDHLSSLKRTRLLSKYHKLCHDEA